MPGFLRILLIGWSSLKNAYFFIFGEYFFYGVSLILFERGGKCNQCGKCCRHVYLRDGGRLVSNFQDYLELIQSNAKYKQFKVKGTNPSGGLYFSCVHVKKDNKCGAYKTRPLLCRTYPTLTMLYHGAKPKHDCGFYFRNRFTRKIV